MYRKYFELLMEKNKLNENKLIDILPKLSKKSIYYISQDLFIDNEQINITPTSIPIEWLIEKNKKEMSEIFTIISILCDMKVESDLSIQYIASTKPVNIEDFTISELEKN